MFQQLLRFSLLISILAGCASPQPSAFDSNVQIAGAMRNVMWKGELGGIIRLDTISDRAGLYGLGPEAYLRGELLIIDGQSYVSRVVDSSAMRVEENFAVEAPFFVYANQTEWTEQALPEEIRSISDLEKYVDQATREDFPRPFVFKLRGTIERAVIHAQNLPPGSSVSSPQEAHQGQVNYPLGAQEVDIVGFFSTEHQGVFTHHDSYLHLHLITADRAWMGHLDEVDFAAGKMQLFLPR